MKTQSKNTLEGVEKLRAIVKWLDNRNEYKNENKTPLQLIKEYDKYILSLNNNYK